MRWRGGIHKKKLGVNITVIINEALEKVDDIIIILIITNMKIKRGKTWVLDMRQGVGRSSSSSSQIIFKSIK